MGANRIQGNYDYLQEAMRVFMRHANLTVALTFQIEGLVDQLQGGAWRGVGAETFYAEMRELILPAMRKLEDALQFVGEGTKKIHHILREAEEEAARLFQGVGETYQANKAPIGYPTSPPAQQGLDTGVADQIRALCKQINDAAHALGVDPVVVGAILYDETLKFDLNDRLQQSVAEGMLASTLPGDASLGVAQMQIQTVLDLIKNGYMIPPPEDMAQYQSDPHLYAIRALLKPEIAPYLVAARIKQTMDWWKSGGSGGAGPKVDISNRPEILVTLYSIGLQGEFGVRPNPDVSKRGAEIQKTFPEIRNLLSGC